MKKVLLLCSVLALVTSCATLFSGTKAKVIVDDRNVNVPVDLTVDGKRHDNILLPAKVKVRRGYRASEITAQARGWTTSTVEVEKKFNPVVLLNIGTGLLPTAIDLATGAVTKPESKYYYFNMQPVDNYVRANYADDPTMVRGEATNMVSRDNPGDTELERTIIRWYFDSDPRGARIYWRVVSSIPSIVKNTNETYLMTTPYEETRSFNILGLTYENSRDVQIEIKVTRRGYEDQVKRFNVRQAIDQQEISAFFELVEKPEEVE